MKKSMKYLLTGIGIVVAGAVVYFLYRKTVSRKDKDDVETKVSATNQETKSSAMEFVERRKKRAREKALARKVNEQSASVVSA